MGPAAICIAGTDTYRPGALCTDSAMYHPLDGGTGGDSSGGSEEESGSDEHRRGGGSPVPVDEQEVRCSRAAPRSPPLTPAPCTAAGLHQLTTRTMYVRSGVGLIG